MTQTKYRSIIIISIFALVLSLASCSGGIDKDEAKVFIDEFLDAIEKADYEKAETYLHPERPADLEEFLVELEDSEGLDFQSDIVIEKYTGFSSAYYDSTVDGSTYELTMKAKVGDKAVKITIEIVKNDNGYGIYNLYIDT